MHNISPQRNTLWVSETDYRPSPRIDALRAALVAAGIASPPTRDIRYDIWHKLNGNYDGTVETYNTGFTALVQKTQDALPDTTIVICEPFALRSGAVNDSWYPEFDERRAVAKEVAQAAKTIWVPFQTMFDEAIAAGTEPQYWAGDGVHPTLAGHALMAQTWRKIVGV